MLFALGRNFPDGLMARIWRFHRHGPGSIPGQGILYVQKETGKKH